MILLERLTEKQWLLNVMFEHQYFLISFSDEENEKNGKRKLCLFLNQNKSKDQKLAWCLWVSLQNYQL